MGEPCQTLPLKLKRLQLKAKVNGHYAAHALYVAEAFHCLMEIFTRLACVTGAPIDGAAPIVQMIGLDKQGLEAGSEQDGRDESLVITLNIVSHAFNLLVCAEHHANEYTKTMQGLLVLQEPARSG
jgi:hypothetical protein